MRTKNGGEDDSAYLHVWTLCGLADTLRDMEERIFLRVRFVARMAGDIDRAWWWLETKKRWAAIEFTASQLGEPGFCQIRVLSFAYLDVPAHR